MIRGGFRHLVVMEHDEVLGVISVRDIIRAWSADRQAAEPALRSLPAGRLRMVDTRRGLRAGCDSAVRTLGRMTAEQLISFARGAPSLDIIDVAGLKAAAVRAFDVDPAGVTAYGTSVGYVPLRKWIAEKHGVAAGERARHQRFAGGRRVRVRALREAGRRGDRGEADLRPHAAQPAQPGRRGAPGHARRRRHRHRRAARAARVRRAPDARAHHPELPEPGRRDAVGRAAHGAARARRRVRLHDLRGRPVRRHPVPRRAPADHAVAGHRTTSSCTRARSPRRCAPASASATWSARRRSSPRSSKRATNQYISPGMVSEAIVHQFCVSGDIDRSIATVCDALGERADRARRVAAQAHPGRAVHRAGRRLLPLDRPARRRRRRQAAAGRGRARASRSSRAATSCSRAASTRCAWPSRRSPSTRSTRAYAGSPRRSTRSAPDRVLARPMTET